MNAGDVCFTIGPAPEIAADLDVAELRCDACDAVLEEWAYYDGEGYLCEPCIRAEVERLIPEAEAYAAEHCKLTARLERYDASLEFRPTREEYAAGMREAYSPSAYAAHCRHNRTNYDALVGDLDRDSLAGRIYYHAIRERIEALIKDAIDHEDFDDDDDDEIEGDEPAS